MDMPRPRPPFLHKHVTRHGKTAWYVRRVHNGKRVRIRAEYGSEAFWQEYHAAVAGTPIAPKDRERGPARGTLAWLDAQYRQTTAWSQLSPATRKQRENIMRGVLKKIGAREAASITRDDIVASREARAKKTPHQARNFLDAMRGLYRWAKENKHVKIDPTEGVENPKRPKSGGFPEWTEAEIARYEERWPIGTRQRVWLDLLLYTGARRGDAWRIGRQHVRDGVATFRTEKSGESVEVAIPILDVLARTLAAGPIGDLTFACTERGRPFASKESFGNAFSEAARAAGIKKSAHGLRKVAATRAADNGATVWQLEALFGWTGGTMAMLYTKAADRRRASRDAAHLLKPKGSPSEGAEPLAATLLFDPTRAQP